MCGSVVEVIHLTFVTLITHEALAAVTGAITATLHGDGAHRVTVTGWWGRRRGGGEGQKTGRQGNKWRLGALVSILKVFLP